ncbi:MAG: phospholipase D family protein [Pseudomonadota bacterium]
MLVLTLFASGCATLPDNGSRVASYALTATDNTALAKKFGTYVAPGESASGFVLLTGGLDAFVARAALVAQAERSIDAQYYLWHDDLVGLSLLAMLSDAADRGVRVRLLLDDIDLRGSDAALAALDAHPNFSVRVFNPFSRRVSRARQYLSRFGSVTRRMHNKSFTVDNQVTVVGGRNIGDEYFEADPKVSFGDLDAMAIGPVVRDVSLSFDQYWNNALSYPVALLAKRPPGEEESARLKQFLAEHIRRNESSVYADALRNSEFVDLLRDDKLEFHWGNARLIADEADKLARSRDRTDLHMAGEIAAAFAEARNEVVIFSPYFIPGEEGTDGLVNLARSGVRVRVLTNSLASNNHSVVHAKYARYRKPLLRAGVEIYEAKAGSGALPRAENPFGSSKETVLHAKSFLIDRRYLFVGSLNFDPRSFTENSEIGIVFESPELAAQIGGWFDDEVASVAYRLALDPDGRDALLWIDASKPEGVNVLRKEPETSWWDRFSMRLMSWLPIESQL